MGYGYGTEVILIAFGRKMKKDEVLKSLKEIGGISNTKNILTDCILFNDVVGGWGLFDTDYKKEDIETLKKSGVESLMYFEYRVCDNYEFYDNGWVLNLTDNKTQTFYEVEVTDDDFADESLETGENIMIKWSDFLPKFKKECVKSVFNIDEYSISKLPELKKLFKDCFCVDSFR